MSRPAGACEINRGVRAGQQKAVGKPFLRLVTAARAYVFQLATSGDVEAVVPVLAPLLSKQGGGSADAAQAAAAAPAVSAADAAMRKKLLDENPCARMQLCCPPLSSRLDPHLYLSLQHEVFRTLPMLAALPATDLLHHDV